MRLFSWRVMKGLENVYTYYRQNAEHTRSFPDGEKTQMILLDSVVCNGNEADIYSCSHEDIGVHDCSHGEDVGVICSK